MVNRHVKRIARGVPEDKVRSHISIYTRMPSFSHNFVYREIAVGRTLRGKHALFTRRVTSHRACTCQWLTQIAPAGTRQSNEAGRGLPGTVPFLPLHVLLRL